MPHGKKEGEIYREIDLHGKRFIIRYGYYDERERQSAYNEPIPIFPDFIALPVYTDDGYPFVTAIQDTCACFEGRCDEDGCHGCKYYECGDDLIGICKCPKNKLKKHTENL